VTVIYWDLLKRERSACAVPAVGTKYDAWQGDNQTDYC